MKPVTLLIPYPPSANRLWRYVAKRSPYKSAHYKTWLEEGQKMLGRQKFETFPGPVSIEIAVGRPDRRLRDLDNTTKPILDLLTAAGVWDDDNQVHRLLTYWTDQVTGVQVDIYPMAEAI